MKIYLLRHCDIDLPPMPKICIGITDVHLSEEGIKRAEALQERFRKVELGAVYSSDLTRCVQTAKIVFPGHALAIEPAFREVAMGEWEGMSFEDIKLKYPEIYRQRGEDIARVCAPGGESFERAAQRAFLRLKEIAQNLDEDAAIVSHAGVNRALICMVGGSDISGLMGISQRYGCVNELSYAHGRFNVEAVNC